MGSDAVLCNCTSGFTGRRCEIPFPDPKDTEGKLQLLDKTLLLGKYLFRRINAFVSRIIFGISYSKVQPLSVTRVENYYYYYYY